jgi:DNA-binding CsgD family transcriptional regulator
MLAVLLVDPAAATPHLERAATANREAGHLPPLTESLSMASIAASMAGDRVSAHRLLDEAAALSTRLDHAGAALAVLQARAFAGLFEGDLEAVRAACSDGERLSRKVGDLYGLKTWLMHLGMADLMAGELGASKPLFAEALRIAHQIDDRVQQGYLLNALGCHAARIGNARLAAQLLGASETIRTGAGNRMMPFLVPILRQAEESATARLGAPRFAAEFNVGRHLGRDAAVRLATDEYAPMAVAAADGRAADALLSTREVEVARLLADGLSNKEIGARLFISVHTVDSHVRSILNKLGVNSRAQVAARMASSRQ